jgi:hypothetical protein
VQKGLFEGGCNGGIRHIKSIFSVILPQNFFYHKNVMSSFSTTKVRKRAQSVEWMFYLKLAHSNMYAALCILKNKRSAYATSL